MAAARAGWEQASRLLAIGTTPVQRQLLPKPCPEPLLVGQHEARSPPTFRVEDVATAPRPAEDSHSTKVEEVKTVAAKNVHRARLKSPGAERERSSQGHKQDGRKVVPHLLSNSSPTT